MSPPFVIVLFGCFLGFFFRGSRVGAMSLQEKHNLRDEAKDMFYHGYYAYMDNAFPADELMPLSCRGRYRGLEPNRGDIDDALGNFSLTLIDSLDTLIVMGDLEEFERGVKSVIDVVTFDHDISVSVFETNIRVVGGLTSAHILAEMVKDRFRKMLWYHGELLNMALDVGYRLLPAFNSSTGLPHPRVNLKYGLKPGKIRNVGETCTACAGTMILEFAALSRLSGEPIFEQKASAAMDVLWSARNRMSNLVGNVLNINTGDWVRRDSGIGAGIDSYYEYVAKAYVLLGEDKYLSRWDAHYGAIMKYLSTGSIPAIFQDVHMHRPSSTSKHFVDALGAFWPGLQVLMGDIKPAIESHEVLYQIMVRHNFIPEAFTTDFQVHWGQHLLRPEFVESTYMLYKATKDPYYLEAGKKVLQSLQKHARVTCGYASIKDVRTLQRDDRMDSFVLSETFKYLYLLFADDNDLIIDIGNFVFTTQGHLLPLSLARLSNVTSVPLRLNQKFEYDEDVEYSRSCPSTDYLFPNSQPELRFEHVRKPFANVVAQKCPSMKMSMVPRRLTGSEFRYSDKDHMSLIKEMGVSIVTLPNGRVQLLHTFSDGITPDAAEEGLLFMQEMIELSNQQMEQTDSSPRVVSFVHPSKNTKEIIYAGPAKFGRELSSGYSITGEIIRAVPINACTSLENASKFWGKIAILHRGDCMFVEKARMIESAGAKGGIVVDNNPESSSNGGPLFAMAGDENDDVSIPMVFLFRKDADILLNAIENNPSLFVTLSDASDSTNIAAETYEKSEEKGYDFMSPLSYFLAKSRKQMERFFKDSPHDCESEELNDEFIQEDNRSVHTDTDPSRHSGGDDLDEDSNRKKNEFMKLEEFLNPANIAIRKLIETKLAQNQELLSTLLKVKFVDLLKLFQKLHIRHGSLEGAYLHLFEMIEETESNDFLVKLKYEAEKESSQQVDELVDQVMDKYKESLDALMQDTSLKDGDVSEILKSIANNNESHLVAALVDKMSHEILNKYEEKKDEV